MFIASTNEDRVETSYKYGDAKALQAYLEAVNLGSVERYNAIGDIMWRGNVKNYSKEDAIKWYRKAAMTKSAYSQYKLAITLLAYNKDQYLREAINLLRNAHMGGIFKAKAVLIDCLNEIGKNAILNRNLKEGLYDLIEAMDLGSHIHCDLVAANIEVGFREGKLDLTKYTKEEWREKLIYSLTISANNHNRASAQKLGELYYGKEIQITAGRSRQNRTFAETVYWITHDLGIMQNYEESIKWLKKAGQVKMAEKVTLEYSNMLFRHKQYDKAYMMTKELVDRYRKPSYYKLIAEMYRDGLGTKKDKAMAKRMYYNATPDRLEDICKVFIPVALLLSTIFSFISITPSDSYLIIPWYDYFHWNFSTLNEMWLLMIVKIFVIYAGICICLWFSASFVSFLVVLGLEKSNKIITFAAFKNYYSLYNVSIVKAERSLAQKYVAIVFAESVIIYSVPLLFIYIQGVNNVLIELGVDFHIWIVLYLLLAIPYLTILHLVNPFFTIRSGSIYPFSINSIILFTYEMLIFTFISFGGTIVGEIIYHYYSLI